MFHVETDFRLKEKKSALRSKPVLFYTHTVG